MLEQSIKEILQVYKTLFPEEIGRFNSFERFVIDKSFGELSDRSKMPYNLTVSEIVISQKTGQILMVKKPSLQMHLQPGGHLLPEDQTPLHTAVRHLK